MQTEPQDPQGEQPADNAEINNQIDTSDRSVLAAALGFDTDDDDTSNEQPAGPDETPAETPDGEQPGAQPEESANGEPAGNTPVNRRRLSVTGLADEDRELAAQAIDMVRKGEAESLPAAIAKLKPTGTQQPENHEPGDEPENTPEAPPQPPSLAELKEKIATLREQRKQAALDFDTDEQLRLTEEIEDAQLEMLRAEQAEQSNQSRVADYQSEYAAAVDEMEAKYAAALDDEASPFAEMLDDKIEAARARKDPRLADPRHIIAFADELAIRLGMSAQPPAATRATKTPVPPPPARKPVGSAVTPSGTTKPQLTGRQAESLLEKATTADLSAALWG